MGPPAASPPGVTAPPTEPPPAWTPARPTNPARPGLALAALVLGIIGLFLCFLFVPSLLALIFGVIAAGRIKRSDGVLTGSGMARAGWILGVIGLVLGVLFWVGAASGSFDDDETAVFDLERGDCVDLDFDPLSAETFEVRTVPVVDCDESHEAQVVLVGELNPDGGRAYPALSELLVEVRNRCLQADVAPEPGVDLADFEAVPVAPQEDSWDHDDGPFVCFAVSRDGPTTGSLIRDDD
jgi:hypothetical protein